MTTRRNLIFRLVFLEIHDSRHVYAVIEIFISYLTEKIHYYDIIIHYIVMTEKIHYIVILLSVISNNHISTDQNEKSFINRSQ